MKNQSELYYDILKECAENEAMPMDVLCNKYELSECSIVYKNMEDLNFIFRSNGQVKLLPQGFATYLAISSQKQSNEQAQQATEQAIKAINYAKYALCISIVTFVVSVIFSILQLVYK